MSEQGTKRSRRAKRTKQDDTSDTKKRTKRPLRSTKVTLSDAGENGLPQDVKPANDVAVLPAEVPATKIVAVAEIPAPLPTPPTPPTPQELQTRLLERMECAQKQIGAAMSELFESLEMSTTQDCGSAVSEHVSPGQGSVPQGTTACAGCSLAAIAQFCNNAELDWAKIVRAGVNLHCAAAAKENKKTSDVFTAMTVYNASKDKLGVKPLGELWATTAAAFPLQVNLQRNLCRCIVGTGNCKRMLEQVSATKLSLGAVIYNIKSVQEQLQRRVAIDVALNNHHVACLLDKDSVMLYNSLDKSSGMATVTTFTYEQLASYLRDTGEGSDLTITLFEADPDVVCALPFTTFAATNGFSNRHVQNTAAPIAPQVQSNVAVWNRGFQKPLQRNLDVICERH